LATPKGKKKGKQNKMQMLVNRDLLLLTRDSFHRFGVTYESNMLQIQYLPTILQRYFLFFVCIFFPTLPCVFYFFGPCPKMTVVAGKQKQTLSLPLPKNVLNK